MSPQLRKRHDTKLSRPICLFHQYIMSSLYKHARIIYKERTLYMDYSPPSFEDATLGLGDMGEGGGLIVLQTLPLSTSR